MKRTPLNKVSKKRRSEQPRVKRWEQACFERDDHKCQHPECEKMELNCMHVYNPLHDILDTHHIWEKQPNPQWKFVLENGITLCRVCHGLIHDKTYDLPFDRDELKQEFIRGVGTIID